MITMNIIRKTILSDFKVILKINVHCFRHTKEMIKKLESAGLGYHVSADETEDKLGRPKIFKLVGENYPFYIYSQI